jgi:hypothetical protein
MSGGSQRFARHCNHPPTAFKPSCALMHSPLAGEAVWQLRVPLELPISLNTTHKLARKALLHHYCREMRPSTVRRHNTVIRRFLWGQVGDGLSPSAAADGYQLRTRVSPATPSTASHPCTMSDAAFHRLGLGSTALNPTLPQLGHLCGEAGTVFGRPWSSEDNAGQRTFRCGIGV